MILCVAVVLGAGTGCGSNKDLEAKLKAAEDRAVVAEQTSASQTAQASQSAVLLQQVQEQVRIMREQVANKDQLMASTQKNVETLTAILASTKQGSVIVPASNDAYVKLGTGAVGAVLASADKVQAEANKAQSDAQLIKTQQAVDYERKMAALQEQKTKLEQSLDETRRGLNDARNELEKVAGRFARHKKNSDLTAVMALRSEIEDMIGQIKETVSALRETNSGLETRKKPETTSVGPRGHWQLCTNGGWQWCPEE